ncbi:DUF6920 family protein [Maribacter halichondriae]|uniref:DUF6920 family protein n=1 Tax=Maribacter halichondriae TaxID=2980554 RepID=UPI0023580D07|nr:DUF6544 family protein [Maribacter sp. Hal144]
MRIVFIILLLLHAFIHLMGFFKAFELLKIEQLSQSISRPIGLLWLFTAILFICSALAYLLKKDIWFLMAITAVVLSQILIVLFWKDAKFGTLANLIILLVGITAYGHFKFKNKVKTEASELLESALLENPSFITKKDIEHLPRIVQKWMEHSRALGKPRTTSVRLRQKGEMKTKPDGNWMPFSAEQYFNTRNPSFVWITKVDAMPLIYMDGRDKLKKGQGEMLIKLLSWFPVVDEGKNEKINSGSMQRYLAEMCWFPSAATENYVSWETIGKHSAKAIMTIDGKQVSGIFTFSEEGDFVSFETQRYFGGGEAAKLEIWFIEAKDYKVFNGIKIPHKCKVTWKLKEGDFNWLNLEITDLEYNHTELWQK